MTDGPAVAIAVVSTNARQHLERCLTSMYAEVEAGRAEVWVVDNASSDGSTEMVRDEFPWVHLIASKKNLGYGRAINLVVEQTTTPWVAPSNEDIELRPGALEQLLHTANQHRQAAVVAPRLELPDGSTQHSVYPFPTLPFTIMLNLGIYLLKPGLADELCLEGHWDPDRPREVPWAIATFMLVRRAALDEVGGFAGDQFMYADDLDLGWRLAHAGWTSRHEPRATVFHAGHVAGKKAFGENLRRRQQAATYSWIARRRGVAMARAIAWVNFVGATFRWVVYLSLAQLSPRFRRRRDFFRRWAADHRAAGLGPRRDLVREH